MPYSISFTHYTNRHYLAKVNRIFSLTGSTLLMLAARSVKYACHVKLHVVRTLIQHGADPKRLSDLGQAPPSNVRMKPGVFSWRRVLIRGGENKTQSQSARMPLYDTMVSNGSAWHIFV